MTGLAFGSLCFQVLCLVATHWIYWKTIGYHRRRADFYRKLAETLIDKDVERAFHNDPLN